MKKRMLFICTLVLASIMFACTGNDSQDGPVQRLDIEEGIENVGYVKLSKYASEINYIPLETSLDCMMSSDEYVSIRKMGDIFYFYSIFGAPVFSFNKEGKFKGMVGVNGRAAHEFTRYIRSFAVNEERNELAICDHTGKLLIYDSNGEFLRSAYIGGEVQKTSFFKIFHSTDDEYFFLRESLDYEIPNIGTNEKYGEEHLVTVNSKGAISDETLWGYVKGITTPKPGRTGVGTAIFDSSLRETDKKFTIISSNDTVYSYNPLSKDAVAEYVIDFGKYALGGSNPSMARFNQNDIFFDTENFLIFSVMFPNSYFKNEFPTHLRTVFVYDKQSRSIKVLKLDELYGHALEFNGFGRMDNQDVKGLAGFTNDLDGGVPFVPRYIKDGRMYQIMDAIRFMDLAERGNSKKMKEVAAQLNEDSNPVLIEVILKK
ncbi:MAG: 6-bladed beta-propeller [Bacteroidales bacterium]|nr:6-bladed beta-propeller [Bacteroidales bacterium]